MTCIAVMAIFGVVRSTAAVSFRGDLNLVAGTGQLTHAPELTGPKAGDSTYLNGLDT